MLQVSTDGKLINTVISYAGEGELPLKINNIPKSKFLIGSDELKCCATGRCSEEEKYALEAFGVRSSVVVLYLSMIRVPCILLYLMSVMSFASIK